MNGPSPAVGSAVVADVSAVVVGTEDVSSEVAANARAGVPEADRD
ncbi:MAG TPA: hypothetical protein VGR61_10545 [Candidatus Dormibacteraeota bacterium]|nr:hypothetical protein [Candidatus Dormibacteraeota bacterium]